MTEAERVLRNLSEAFNEGDLEGAAGQFADECEWDFRLRKSIPTTIELN